MNSWVEAPQDESPPCHVLRHWSIGSGDIKYLICHVTSQNRVIQGSSNFMREALHGLPPTFQVKLSWVL